MENILLGVAILGAVYAWCRADFRVPGWLPAWPAPPRRMVVFAGCLIVLLTSLNPVGAVIVGRIQVGMNPTTYARRDTQPGQFWRRLVFEIALGVSVGGGLIAMGRARPASSAASRDRARARVDGAE